MTTPTIGDLIAKHNEIKTYAEAEQTDFDARMKPYRDAMEAINGAILAELQRQGVQNFKTDAGTAYQQTTMSVKVDNRADFLQFVTEKDRWDFLDARCLKDPVKEWLDKNDGVVPPGVKVDFFTKCNIRRS